MKTTIAFFTTTRAEFGILSSFIRKVKEDQSFSTLLFVGGTHLKKEFGYTINEINNFGFEIDGKFDYLEDGDTPFDLSKSCGKCIEQVAEIFRSNSFDYICLLGDRYELVPIVLTSILFNVPIIHFGGGEITEGVIDNQIRHMVTQASFIHLTAADEFSRKIKEMGIPENNIKTVGSLVVEQMKNISISDKQVLFKSLNLDVSQKTIILTYHPVTLKGKYSQLEQIENIFDALDEFDFQVVVTSPNLENEREVIINYIADKVKYNNKIHFFESLGVKKYHSLIPHCEFVIGNSSSGLFEVPFFRKPTINIGDRQKGRFLHNSVIQTTNEKKSIIDGIKQSRNTEFLNEISVMEYKYGDGNSASLALEFIKEKIL